MAILELSTRFMLLNTKIHQKIKYIKVSCIQTFEDAVERGFRGGMLTLIMITLMWVAVFLYVIFYYSYVPAPSYSRSIHLQVKPCKNGVAECPYPSAHVRLTKRYQLLKMGQPYKFTVLLDMPESPVNKVLGMFMVCIQLKDKKGFLASQSCRSNMLHYRSDLLHMTKILLLNPLFLFWSKEEKQTLSFELYSDFEEDRDHPVTDFYIEIQSNNVEIYTATLHINAVLGGLSYFMYYWPITSSILGIAFNLFIVFFTASLSLYHKVLVGAVPVNILRARFNRNFDLTSSLLPIREENSDTDEKVSTSEDAISDVASISGLKSQELEEESFLVKEKSLLFQEKSQTFEDNSSTTDINNSEESS